MAGETLSLDEGANPLLGLLQQVVFEDNLFKKFNAVDILISALDDEVAKATTVNVIMNFENFGDEKFKPKSILVNALMFKEWMHIHIINNSKFMRLLHLHSKMADNIETSIEYYGHDYLTHPEFNFDKSFTDKINEANRCINQFIGLLIKQYSEGDAIEI